MTDNTHPHDPTEKNYSGTVTALLNAKEWFNNGDCCGQVDCDGVCAAPACMFGTALTWFHRCADEIEALAASRNELYAEHAAHVATPSDDDGDMLTAAYLSGAHNAKATIQNLREQIAAIDKAVSDAGEPPLTGDNATIVDRIASLGRDILRLHDEKCDALDRIAALKALLREAVETLQPFATATDYTSYRDSTTLNDRETADQITYGDIRRARDLAARIEKEFES